MFGWGHGDDDAVTKLSTYQLKYWLVKKLLLGCYIIIVLQFNHRNGLKLIIHNGVM